MRLARTGVALGLLAAAGSPATARASVSATPAPRGRLSETITLTTTVPTGDNSYRPAYYVDWRNGACPASAGVARSAAKGDTTRGLGFAEVTGGGTDSVPVEAKVVLEQPQQKVCFYGGAGALADQISVSASVTLPPLEFGKPANEWGIGALGKLRIGGGLHAYPLGFDLSLHYKGTRSTFATITCKRKRFNLIKSRIHIGANGMSYSGPVRADNSNNYDHPIPLKYFGHATLSFHAPLTVGRTPLKGPISGRGVNLGSEPPPLGVWGVPVARINAHFSAPGFRPFKNQAACGSRLKAFANSNTEIPVMADQGTARLGGTPDEAGIPLDRPDNFGPNATFNTDNEYHSVSQGTGTVTFTSYSTDDDDGIASEVWDFGDGTTGSGHEVSHTYSAAGDYTVVLTVTDHHGAKASYTATAYVDG